MWPILISYYAADAVTFKLFVNGEIRAVLCKKITARVEIKMTWTVA